MDASIFVLALFPTLSELLRTQSHSEVGVAASYILATFMVGWTVGSAVFGMLADRIGRVNTMIITILLYAIFTGLCAISHNAFELGVYRFFVGCGIGGEISVGAVLLAEAWNGKSRYWATGVMCTSFGFGYLVTALVNMVIGQAGWRWLYLFGMLPALLTIYLRLKLKESKQFEAARTAPIKHENASMSALFNAENRHKTICVMALASACIVGYWAVLAWIPAWVNHLVGTSAISERSTTVVILNIGSILGAIAMGVIYGKLGSKKTFLLSFIGAFISCVVMFMTVKSYGVDLLAWAFVVGFFAEAPFVPLFIYVPELFGVRQRATGFGVSVQSGRLFAAAAAITAGQLIAFSGGSYAIAGSTIACVYLLGMAACAFMPATAGDVTVEDGCVGRCTK